MEKMKYESPEMEIIRFDTQDIITTSEIADKNTGFAQACCCFVVFCLL